ncbi:MAG: putative porin [Cytophagaceae bacterium]
MMFVVICLGRLTSTAQILDDSTKLVYGPHSTSYVLEEDIMNNSGRTHSADTSIDNVHNYTRIFQGHEPYQDLGNLGTPASPIFYRPPSQIGKTLGYNGFNPYAYNPQRIRYFDTKSPYSCLSYIQGSRGQQILEGDFYRNVTPRWNVGFSVKTLVSKKVIGALSSSSSADNRLASIFNFVLASRYFSKNERYQVLGNLTFFDGKNKESGGIRPDSLDQDPYKLFTYNQANAYLYSARTLEKRFNLHLYQELGITNNKVLQLFHIGDIRSVAHRFTDVRSGGFLNDTLYYPGTKTEMLIKYNLVSTDDKIVYNLFENKAGIKGRAGQLSYIAYLRRKDFSYLDTVQVVSGNSLKKTFSENFVGGGLRYQISDSSFVNVTSEYLYLGKNDKDAFSGSDFFLKADYYSRYLFGGFYSINSSPTLLQRRYEGNNISWNNEDFKPILSNNTEVGARLPLKNLLLQASAEYSLLKNYVYYNELAKPAQDSSLINIVSIKALMKLRLGKFHLEEHFRFTDVSSAVIKVPRYYSQTRLYYQNMLFKKAVFMQIGFDFFWKSAYMANYYMPVTQQYFLNNDFVVKPYLLGDFFVNAQVKSATVFIKVAHFNQLPLKGYYITPYYSGMPRTVELGIRWMFFD